MVSRVRSTARASGRSLLKRVDERTNEILNELQAILAARNIHLSHKDIIAKAVEFVRERVLEFYEFITRNEEDGLKRYLRKIVRGGEESDAVAEHNMVM